MSMLSKTSTLRPHENKLDSMSKIDLIMRYGRRSESLDKDDVESFLEKKKLDKNRFQAQ